MNRTLRSTLASIAAALSLLGGMNQSFPAIGQAASAQERIYYQPRTISSPGSGRPRGTRSGSCAANPTDQPKLIALVPENDLAEKSNDAAKVHWGQTVSQRPMLWFYVSYTSLDLLPVELIWQKEGDITHLYRTKVVLPETPGVIGVQLPLDAPELELNQWYFWSLSIKCNTSSSDSSTDEVSGLIQRVALAPAIQKQIEAANAQQQVKLYAKNGIWFDALTTLGKLRQAKPNDATLKTLWNSLLNDGGLEQTATAPIAK